MHKVHASISFLVGGKKKVSSHHPDSFSQNIKLVCADSFHAPRENLRDPLNSSKLAAHYITTANTYNSFQSIGNIWNIYTKLSVISLTLNYHTRYDVRSFTENSLRYLHTWIPLKRENVCNACYFRYFVHETTLKRSKTFHDLLFHFFLAREK